MPWLLLLLLGGGAVYYVTEYAGTYGGPSGASQTDTAKAVQIALTKETNANNLQGFAAALLPYNAAWSAQLSGRAAQLNSGSLLSTVKPTVTATATAAPSLRPAMKRGV